MTKREDKLKSLLLNNSLRQNENKWPEEIHISKTISPIANIKVIWVGWGWTNTVNRMIQSWFERVEFIAMNTDSQALYESFANEKLNLWKVVTWWLGAWADPATWKKAAEESRDEIKNLLEWAHMVFITCWLGWWTWTWAAPVIAEVAKELWALTVWVVTKPFSFEWQNRAAKAIDWYEELKEKVDTLITIPNDKILSIIDKKTPMLDAFSIVDEVLSQWVQWISDLIINPWIINLDFADIKSVMRNAWSALMWIWYGSWENRAIEAARAAMDSPLLDLSIAWAKWLLLNITWGHDLSMFEVDEAAKVITESVDPEANIIFGTSIVPEYDWQIKITVVATWFTEETNKKFLEKRWESIRGNFGRKPVWFEGPKPAPANSSTTFNWSNTQNSLVHKTPNNQEEIDSVPAFLRKKL